jgi:hypothetical protein
MSSDTDFSIANLVNDLFSTYRHPDGREYTHKEVEAGITRRAGKKLIDASYLSKLRTGTLQKPSILAVEALCHFFPVDVDYFFPSITALRKSQTERGDVERQQVLARNRLLRQHVEAMMKMLNEQALLGDENDETTA